MPLVVPARANPSFPRLTRLDVPCHGWLSAAEGRAAVSVGQRDGEC